MKGFIYSCIGDNSPENREHLERLLGYTYFGSFLIDRENAKYIKTVQGTNKYIVSKGYPDDKCINCIDNHDLFQAVTAVRDDSDYMQWFYNSYYNNWNRCELGDAIDYFYLFWMTHARKASLVELQEHFNN